MLPTLSKSLQIDEIKCIASMARIGLNREFVQSQSIEHSATRSPALCSTDYWVSEQASEQANVPLLAEPFCHIGETRKAFFLFRLEYADNVINILKC